MTATANLRAALELVDGLAAGGVAHAFVSPGSRSSPLAVACALHPAIEAVPVLDERAAAFAALAAAAAGDAPALVVATSGSAPGNWLPAVLEADHGRVPLVLASASRPFDLVAVDAPQSTDQDLFGRHARLVVRLDAPSPGTEPRPWRRVGARAAAAARDPVPGPVHLDLAFRKPLLPGTIPPAEKALGRRPAGTGDGGPRFHPALRLPAEAALDALATRVRAARRPVLVAGPGPVSRRRSLRAVARFCRGTGVPLLAEASSGWRFRGPGLADLPAGDRFDLFWRHPGGREALHPDLVLLAGLPPVSRGLAMLLAEDPGLPVVILADHGWNDPWHRAVEVVAGDPAATLAGLAERLAGRGADPAWTAAWSRAEAAADEAEAALAVEEEGRGPLAEALAVRTLVEALPPGTLLLPGNGMAVRELDLHVPGGAADLAVVHRRGQSGIEGYLAALAGAARTWREGPVVALAGDLAARHDAGSLEVLAGTGAPALAVVLDNGGGRIFDRLPVAAARGLGPAFRDLFRLPGGPDPVRLAEAHGLLAERAATAEELAAAVRRVLEAGGPGLVAVATDGDGIGARLDRLVAETARAAGWTHG